MQPLKQEKNQIIDISVSEVQSSIFSPNLLTYYIVETWDIAYFLPWYWKKNEILFVDELDKYFGYCDLG